MSSNDPVVLCSAVSSRTGKPCSQRPIRGGSICATHGGSAGQVRAAANRRLLEAKIAGELRVLGWEPLVDPVGKYADLAGEIEAFKDLARERVNRLSTWDHVDLKGSEDAKAAVQVYERAMDRFDKTLATMIRLGIESRKVTLEEAKGRQVQALIEALFVKLELSPEQLVQGRAAVPLLITELFDE